MGFSFQLCVVATLISHVSCDFRCICNYMANLPVYSKASLQSSQIGVLDEYMCKFDAQSPLTDWFAIEYKRQVGYVQSNSGMVLRQNCPGSPPIADAVTSVPVVPSRTMVKTPPSTSTTKSLTIKAVSTKPNTLTLTPTSITTTSTIMTSTTRTIATKKSPLPTITQGDISLCHPDLVRWSKESPVQFLYQYKDKCFATSFDSGTFDETVLHCKENGGKMITVSNGIEEKFVETFVRQTVNQPVWIGASTNSDDYKWTFNFGHYTNWASAGIPVQFSISANNSNLYSCSVLDPTLGGKWRMTACTSIQRGICEFPVSNTQHSHQSTQRNDVGAPTGNLLAGSTKTTPAHNSHQNFPVFINGDARSSYVHWAPSEPSETVLSNRDCTLLNPKNHGLWETRSCEAQHTYICEFGNLLLFNSPFCILQERLFLPLNVTGLELMREKHFGTYLSTFLDFKIRYLDNSD